MALAVRVAGSQGSWGIPLRPLPSRVPLARLLVRGMGLRGVFSTAISEGHDQKGSRANTHTLLAKVLPPGASLSSELPHHPVTGSCDKLRFGQGILSPRLCREPLGDLSPSRHAPPPMIAKAPPKVSAKLLHPSPPPCLLPLVWRAEVGIVRAAPALLRTSPLASQKFYSLGR